MPNYVRWREPGAMYFFTVVTAQRRPLFADQGSRTLLRSAFAATRAERPFQMPASVLLPDHWHCIWQLPQGDDDFPLRWRLIKSRFTRGYLAGGGSELGVTADHRRQHRRGVWQPRYWEHRIRDEDDYRRHRDYIHMNPVKHGLVRSPEDWPWSTVHEHLRRGELAPDWHNTVQIRLPDFE